MSEREPLLPLSDSQREALEEATATYHRGLDLTDAVVQHLVGRGLDKGVADTFRLGAVDDPMPGHERFRGFLAIPYLGHGDRPLTIRFRCVHEHVHRDFGHGKYMSLPDDEPRIFNVRAIHAAAQSPEGVLHVTEGEFDAMVLSKIGLHAVAIPGAHLWSPHFRRAMAGFNRVWVWGDPDDAGADLVNRITRSLRSAKGVRLRDGDVTETYLAGGADALLGLIETKESAA